MPTFHVSPVPVLVPATRIAGIACGCYATAAWSDEGKLLGLVTRTDVLRERKLYASVGGTGQRRVR